MASPKSTCLLASLLSFNLLFFSIVSGCGNCTPKPPCPSPPATETCPTDTLKLGVCADLLGLINVSLGNPPVTPCCTLLEGLVDLEAAVCLCTALKANILGINLNIPVSLSLLLNVCSKKVPPGFQCA